jgi:anti-anti-sigma factor
VIETQLLANSGIVCRPSGSLDWIAAVSLRHVIGDLLQPGVKLTIDLSRVEFIDAVGISAIVGSVRRVRAVGGRAHVCHPSPQVRWCLELAGISRLVVDHTGANGNDAQ